MSKALKPGRPIRPREWGPKAKLLQRARQRSGLSQSQFAALLSGRTGYSLSMHHISRWENKGSPPEDIQAVLEAFIANPDIR